MEKHWKAFKKENMLILICLWSRKLLKKHWAYQQILTPKPLLKVNSESTESTMQVVYCVTIAFYFQYEGRIAFYYQYEGRMAFHLTF